MITAGELAEKIGGSLSGDENAEIFGINYAADSVKNDAAVVMAKKDLQTCNADTILSNKFLLCFNKTLIYAPIDINLLIVKAANILVDNGLCKDYRAVSYTVFKNGYACGEDVKIGEGSTIGAYSVIESGCSIGKNCRIGAGVYIGADTFIGDNVIIGAGTKIASESIFHAFENKYQHFAGVGRVLIENDVFIGCNAVFQRGTLSDTVIGSGTVIGDLVDIGHDCKISSNCRIVSQCGISGNVIIGENSVIYGQSGIANFVKVGKNVSVIAKTSVTKDIMDGETVSGRFGRNHTKVLQLNVKAEKFFNERN